MALLYFTLITILLVLTTKEIKCEKEIEFYRYIKEEHDKLLAGLDEVLENKRNN